MIKKYEIKKFSSPSIAVWEKKDEIIIATIMPDNNEGFVEMFEVFSSNKFILILNYGVVVTEGMSLIPFEALQLLDKNYKEEDMPLSEFLKNTKNKKETKDEKEAKETEKTKSKNEKESEEIEEVEEIENPEEVEETEEELEDEKEVKKKKEKIKEVFDKIKKKQLSK